MAYSTTLKYSFHHFKTLFGNFDFKNLSMNIYLSQKRILLVFKVASLKIDVLWSFLKLVLARCTNQKSRGESSLAFCIYKQKLVHFNLWIRSYMQISLIDKSLAICILYKFVNFDFFWNISNGKNKLKMWGNNMLIKRLMWPHS